MKQRLYFLRLNFYADKKHRRLIDGKFNFIQKLLLIIKLILCKR